MAWTLPQRTGHQPDVERLVHAERSERDRDQRRATTARCPPAAPPPSDSSPPRTGQQPTDATSPARRPDRRGALVRLDRPRPVRPQAARRAGHAPPPDTRATGGDGTLWRGSKPMRRLAPRPPAGDRAGGRAAGDRWGPAAVLRTSAAQALDNGVGRTPPMGWNSWNTFGCNINETLIRQMADAMVSTGMRDLGYQYVVVDDCWMNPNRDSAGNLQGDPRRFPSGMKALGDYLHARGLKFGIYQAPLDKTCAQYFGSYPGATGSRATRPRTPGSSPPGASTTSSTTGAPPPAPSTTRYAPSPRCATRWPPPAGRSSTASTPTASTPRPARSATGATSPTCGAPPRTSPTPGTPARPTATRWASRTSSTSPCRWPRYAGPARSTTPT